MAKALIHLRCEPTEPDLSPRTKKWYIEDGDHTSDIPEGVIEVDYFGGSSRCLYVEHQQELTEKEKQQRLDKYHKQLESYKKWEEDNADLIKQERERRIKIEQDKAERKRAAEEKRTTKRIVALERELKKLKEVGEKQ